jgi:hypothetical protein
MSAADKRVPPGKERQINGRRGGCQRRRVDD